MSNTGFFRSPTAEELRGGNDCDRNIHLDNPRKFLRVIGYQGRCNDVVYCKPLVSLMDGKQAAESLSSQSSVHNEGRCVVYFGGDIQDFLDTMELEQQKEYKSHLSYNLEATARLLQKQFPYHHIVVVRPSRVELSTYSCFDNFVSSTSNTGVPNHTITHGSLQHLQLLLRNLSDRVKKSQQQDSGLSRNIKFSTTQDATIEDGMSSSSVGRNTPDNEKCTCLERTKISVVGFSKGCVVLNQFLYEFHFLKTLTPDDTAMNLFLLCITDMYWLDGGHNGTKNTWITSRSIIETLCRTGISIHVHVTPYQMNDERRPWIRKEEQTFLHLIQHYNGCVKRFFHYENEEASLKLHFQLIGEFHTAELIKV